MVHKLKAKRGRLRRIEEQAESLSKAQLLALLKFLLVLLQVSRGAKSLSGKQRRSLAITEQQLSVRLPTLSRRSRRGSRRSSRHGNIRGLMKAIRANRRMSQKAKRKALATLRTRLR